MTPIFDEPTGSPLPSTKNSLTDKEEDVLSALKRLIEKGKISPSIMITEPVKFAGLSAPTVITESLDATEIRNFFREWQRTYLKVLVGSSRPRSPSAK